MDPRTAPPSTPRSGTPGGLRHAGLHGRRGPWPLASRFIGGLGYATNLSTAYPLGACGSASTSASGRGPWPPVASPLRPWPHIFGGHRFEAVTRPGPCSPPPWATPSWPSACSSTSAAPWAIWKPMFFQKPHLGPVSRWPCASWPTSRCCGLNSCPSPPNATVNASRFWARWGRFSDKIMDRAAHPWGVVLSCMHQSSLGTLMLVAPTKLHPPVVHPPSCRCSSCSQRSWWGYAMVIFETGHRHGLPAPGTARWAFSARCRAIPSSWWARTWP